MIDVLRQLAAPELLALGRVRQKQPREPKVSLEEFWRQVTDDGRAPCELADATCFGRKTAHHWLAKRYLRTAAARLDPRNGVCLCAHHHERVECLAAESPLPSDAAAFIADHYDAIDGPARERALEKLR